MANLLYDNLPDGIHDVLVGPQDGLFLTGYDSIRRLCLVLYAPPFGQRMRVLSQLPYSDYGRYTPTVLGAHDVEHGALYVLLYQQPISWGIERMSLYRIYPESGEQKLLSDASAPFWTPTGILPRPDGSVLVGMSGYGPLMRYTGCNDTACARLETLDTAASNATGKSGMADIRGPDGHDMLCLVVGADELLGRAGSIVCERPDGSLHTIWTQRNGTDILHSDAWRARPSKAGTTPASSADDELFVNAEAPGSPPVRRGRALGDRRAAARRPGGGSGGSGFSGELWQRDRYWRPPAPHGAASAGRGAAGAAGASHWQFNALWREPVVPIDLAERDAGGGDGDGGVGAAGDGTGSEGGSSVKNATSARRASPSAQVKSSQAAWSSRRRSLSDPAILARGPPVALQASGGGGTAGGSGASAAALGGRLSSGHRDSKADGGLRYADSLLIVSRDAVSEFGFELGSVHALLPREPAEGEKCGAAGCWAPPRPVATSLSNPRGVAVDQQLGKLYVVEQNSLHGSNYELFAGDVLEFCTAGYYDCSAGQNSGECVCASGYGGACCDTPAGAVRAPSPTLARSGPTPGRCEAALFLYLSIYRWRGARPESHTRKKRSYAWSL